MDWPLLFGVASSIVSTVLAVVAMGQSLYFYNQAKASERATAETLAAIRAQTQTLEKLTGRQLDRLTRFATQPRDSGPDIIHLVGVVKELANVSAATSSPVSPRTSVAQAERDALIRATYNTFYFAALANIAWVGYMVKDTTLEEADEEAYGIIDETHRFYFSTLNELLGVPVEELDRVGIRDRIDNIRARLESSLATSSQVKEARQAAG